ncbi:MAG: sigma-70 family RNA polymerase sigma factor [Gemmataceae bacterium]
MARRQVGHFMGFLRRAVGPADAARSDRELLAAFAAGDHAAFQELLERHGPMVLALCRRLLSDEHAAEDAFQATFLVLARKAGSPGWHESIGCWLHEVATRTALQARSQASRRRAQELKVDPMTLSEPTAELAQRELQAVVDDELRHLPHRYRAPLVLCYLEGKTNEQAARELGWPTGSMSRRLDKGRELLRARLQRRGLALSSAALATLLPAQSASAALAPTLNQSTMNTIALDAEHGRVPASISILAEGVQRAMYLNRLKTLGTVFAVIVLCLATSAAAWQAFARPQPFVDASVSEDDLPPAGPAHVQLWDEGDVTQLVFTADGQSICGGGDRLVVQWDLATRKAAQRLPVPANAAARIAPGGKEVAFSGRESAKLGYTRIVLRVVGLADGKELASHSNGGAPHNFPAECKMPMAFSGDGQIVAFWGPEGVDVWQRGAKARTCRLPLNDLGYGQVHALALTADGKVAASVHEYISLSKNKGERTHLYATRTLTLWDARTARKLYEGSVARSETAELLLAFAPDGKSLVVAAAQTGAMIVLEVPSGKVARRLGPGRLDLEPLEDLFRRLQEPQLPRGVPEILKQPAKPEVTGLTIAADSRTLASAHGNGSVQLWDLESGKPLRKLMGKQTATSSVTFSRDGRKLASGGPDGSVEIWDLAPRVR